MWNENKSHRWKLNSKGEVDEFAFSEGYHNGPVCDKCGGGYFCIHCSDFAEAMMSKDCDVIDYVCSECGKSQ